MPLTFDMDASIHVPDLLQAGHSIRPVAEDIFSVLPASGGAAYDRYATMYDWLAGSRLYNRIVWGNTPVDYTDFARTAYTSTNQDWHLDAGGGSLLFTAEVYLESSRPVIVFDRSLAMLSRARQRLAERAGSVPDHVVLLQGDLFNLPFRARSFGSILCMHVLHVIDDAPALLRSLNALRSTSSSSLSLTSLVQVGRGGRDLYMHGLYRSGEFARPRTPEEVRRMVEDTVYGSIDFRVRGSLAYAAAGA